ncbi:signal transduction histidine kinase [Paenibacillus shirakamiensis]|uniref:histidine kinase n=1 Tax=Paenibacillus shirakamiensis TaxID=1265935 RepID=A0ABS4JGT0_9BACL|nr:HAMP domain-containing sensor histidine kinase [Paenibacillus shirakamiensis]MBP2000156.1 signal transduction histidine kinase [Paenibacillus shirakamiensis]
MSIRVKLLLSYAAMLVIPLVLIGIMAILLTFVYRGDVQSLKNAYESKFEGIEEGDMHNLIKHTFVQNKDLLSNTQFLDDFSADLLKKNTNMYIRSSQGTLYKSTSLVLSKELTDSLSSFVKEGEHHEPIQLKLHDTWMQVAQYDLLSKANEPITLFLLTKMDPWVHFVRTFFPILFLATLFTLLVTHILLTTYMSRKIIRPLQELRRAAIYVTEGHLDFQIAIHGKDELGQLGMAFEAMRSKLEESIQIQQQYENNRKELITNISHDLKTPITAIKGYIDGILEGVANSPEKNEKYMRTIATKAGDMDHLIDELFLYSKLDMQKVEFHFESVPILPFLKDWAEELHIELDKQRVELKLVMLEGEHTYVRVDRESFKRVLANIIQNSLKYMDKPNRTITLLTKQQGQQFILTISDNGPGIPAEACNHVFERFYRAEQSRNTNTGGSGLGLAIAKQIITGHGGMIYAESLMGEGLTLSIVLPIDEGELDDDTTYSYR